MLSLFSMDPFFKEENWNKHIRRLSKISPPKLSRGVVKILALISSKPNIFWKNIENPQVNSFSTMCDTIWLILKFDQHKMISNFKSLKLAIFHSINPVSQFLNTSCRYFFKYEILIQRSFRTVLLPTFH